MPEIEHTGNISICPLPAVEKISDLDIQSFKRDLVVVWLRILYPQEQRSQNYWDQLR